MSTPGFKDRNSATTDPVLILSSVTAPSRLDGAARFPTQQAIAFPK
jgi:hypothetical protein